MSEYKRQFETSTVISYKSQGTAAKYLRSCDIFNKKNYCTFTAECACKRIL